MIETRLLLYFSKTAELLHFGQAASELGISQPALSQQMKQLEEKIGVQLLYRTRHQVSLTKAGEAFLLESSKALNHIQHAIQTARRADRGEIGELAIGYVGSVIYSFLPGVVNQFREQYPGVELQLRELNTAEQAKAIKRGELDIGFLYGPVPEPEIVTKTILNLPLYMAVHEDHKLASGKTLNIQALSGEPFVFVSRQYEPGLHDRYIAIFQKAGVVPRIVQRANQIHTILGLVASGIGLFPVPMHVKVITRPGLKYIKVSDEKSYSIELSMACKEKPNNPTVDTFTSLLLDSLDNS